MKNLRPGPFRGDLVGTPPSAPGTGPVPPFVSAAPEAHHFMVGAAVIFQIAASQGLNFPAEYLFGTHTPALVTAEAQKTQQWAPVKGGAQPQIGAYVYAGAAPFDPNVPAPSDAFTSASGGFVPRIGTFQLVGEVRDPTGPQSVDVNASASGGFPPRIAAFHSVAEIRDPTGPQPVDVNASASGGSVPQLATFQSVGEVRDPNGPPAVDPNAPAAGGALPRIGAVVVAGPSPFEPSVIQPQTFDIAIAAIPPFGVLGEYQSAAGPFDPTQAGARLTPTAAPQGLVLTAEYTFGTHAQTLYDAEARKSKQWSSARTQPVASQVATFQWSSPSTLDVIQGWIETPTFNPQGMLMPCQDAGPSDLWSLSSQFSRGATSPYAAVTAVYQRAAPQSLDSIQGWIETPTFSPQGPLIGRHRSGPSDLWSLSVQYQATVQAVALPVALPLRLQITGPQPLDSIQANQSPSAVNPQGPTIRAYAGAPTDTAPAGSARSFAITRSGAPPTTGPVPLYAVTASSPADPTPSAPQKFANATGGALPVLAAYQIAVPQNWLETPAAQWRASLIGPSLALQYQLSSPQPLDALQGDFTPAARSAPAATIRAFSAAPEVRDFPVAPAIWRSVPAPLGYLGRYVSASPLTVELPILQAQTQRPSAAPLVIAPGAFVIIAALDNLSITVNYDQLRIIPTPTSGV